MRPRVLRLAVPYLASRFSSGLVPKGLLGQELRAPRFVPANAAPCIPRGPARPDLVLSVLVRDFLPARLVPAAVPAVPRVALDNAMFHAA